MQATKVMQTTKLMQLIKDMHIIEVMYIKHVNASHARHSSKLPFQDFLTLLTQFCRQIGYL